MKTSRYSEFVPAIFIVSFALFGLFYLMPNWVKSPGRVDVEALAPAFWPGILFYGMLLLGILMGLLQFLLEPPTSPADPDDMEAFEKIDSKGFLRITAAIIILIAYYLLIPSIGIVVASIIVSAALILLSGDRRIVLIAVTCCSLPVALYYFFVLVANKPLPLGIFEVL